MNIYYYAVYKECGDGVCEIYSVQSSPSELNDENAISMTKESAVDLATKVNNPEVCIKIKEKDIADFKWYVEKKDIVVTAKENAIHAIREHYVHVMNSVALFEMYNVMMINNELGANGYFITTSNREEKYIDIINSGDEKLITLLQEYLEMKDRIDPLWTYYLKHKEAKDIILSSTSVEEINKIVDGLISYLN